MDSNNFKKLFGNLLGKKRNNTESLKENTENKTEDPTNAKKYVKYGDIIDQKIKENLKREEILKNFDKEEIAPESMIVKTHELIKQKNKKFEEDKEKEKEKEEKLNKEKLKETENLDKDGKIILAISSDSNDSEFGSDKEYRENVTKIPNEFHIDICNKEWNLNIDTKK